MNRFFKVFTLNNQEAIFFKAIPGLLWQLLFFGIPLALLIMVSFLGDVFAPFSFANITMIHYKNLMHYDYAKILLRSLWVALVTALSCLFIGYPLTYYITIRKKKLKNIFLFFLVLPFVTNLLVLTYAWNFVLDKDGLVNSILLKIGIITEPLLILNSFFAILLVMFYCYLPFMIMPLFTSLEKFDVTLIEASYDLGATQWQTFYKVILPLTMPAIQTGFLLVFVPAFGEFVIPLLMGGDKYMFVGSLISHLFLTGQDRPLGAAFTLVSSLLLCCLVICFMMLFKKYRNYIPKEPTW